MDHVVTRDDLVQSLKAIRRKVNDRIVIVRTVIRADGTHVAVHRKSVALKTDAPTKKERKQA